MLIKFASPHKLHDEKNSIFCLEDMLHIDDEWVFGLHEHLLFEKAVGDKCLLEKQILPDGLHRIDFILALHQKHLAEAALAD